MNRTCTAVLFSLLAACSGTITDGLGGGGGDESDREPPTIEIETPARGSMVEGNVLSVSGRVTDAGSAIAEVRVNGQVAALSGDRFTVDLGGATGMVLLTTKATDTAGNVASDNRAVLMGSLAPQSTRVSDGIVARIDGQAMGSLAGMVSNVAESLNLTTVVRAYNPVATTGDGCNGARVYVDSISRTSIPVTATPASGGIATSVQVRGLRINGHVDFNALCIAGSTGWTITATSYNVSGDLRPRLSSGSIAVSLDNVASTFAGFNLSLGVVPDFVIDLFEGQVKNELAAILRERIQQMIPPLANSFLSDFVQDEWTAYAVGQTIDVTTRPTLMTWTTSGGRIALETSTSVRGAEDAMYLPTPKPAPAALGAVGLRVAVADDVANQLLAGMWGAGAFALDIVPQAGDPVLAFFDTADRIVVDTLLPPMISADNTTGTLKLSVGDAIAEIIDEDGVGTLAKFAITAEIDLAATLDIDGRFALQTGAPLVTGQILEQSDTLLTPLDAAVIEAFGGVAITQLAKQADTMLSVIPIPGVGGEVTSPTFETTEGYVVVGGSVSLP